MGLFWIIMLVGAAGIGWTFLKAREVQGTKVLKQVQVRKTTVRTEALRAKKAPSHIEVKHPTLVPVKTNQSISMSEANVAESLREKDSADEIFRQAIAEEEEFKRQKAITVGSLPSLSLPQSEVAVIAIAKMQVEAASTREQLDVALAGFQSTRVDVAKRIAEREGITYTEALIRMGMMKE